jgi:anti-sigma regulatory factor (Ser/Thr protein kinase)
MFEITISAKEESISQVREFYQNAANDCGLSAEKVYAVLTAVEEAVWNIIEHSYVENDSGQIHCRAESTSQGLLITLVDHGNPMPPGRIPERNHILKANPRQLGGMGLYLMFHLMDKVHFDFSTPGENTLTMLKKIS